MSLNLVSIEYKNWENSTLILLENRTTKEELINEIKFLSKKVEEDNVQ